MKIQPKPKNDKHAELTEEEKSTPIAQALEKIITTYVPRELMSFSEKANFADTLSRAYKAWTEIGLDLEFAQVFIDRGESKANLYEMLKDILATGFPSAHTSLSDDVGLVTQGPIFTHGLCPHHLLPVDYEIYVSYQPTPGGTILGLSKLARLCKVLSTRPVLQEDLGADIAAVLHHSEPESDPDLPAIESQGSAVQLTGCHHCMKWRGVQSDALTLTTVLRGKFATNVELKNEFYQAIAAIRASGWLPSEKENLDKRMEDTDEIFDDDFPDVDDLSTDDNYEVTSSTKSEADKITETMLTPRTYKRKLN